MQDTLSFTGYNIALTGGASGIGLAVAQTVLAQGGVVYIADLVDVPPDDLKDQERVHFTGNCDITQREACKAFLNSIPGRLDGLVNCAGVCPWEGNVASDKIFQLNMSVNVTGTWNMSTEAIIRMSHQEEQIHAGATVGSIRTVGQGSIVTIGSVSALRGTPGLAAYTASKHAVLGLTRTWAKDNPRMRVNMVAPGLTDTPMARSAFLENSDPNAKKGTKDLLAGIPKGRLAYPTDIADAVIFLLSDWSSYMTGQVLPVNGGNF